MPKSAKRKTRKKVFISYRRQDAGTQATRIAEKLESRLNCEAFVDKARIDAGADWLKKVQGAIENADMVLVLIGPNWLAAADFEGKRRLLDNADIVRREIGFALKKERALIPVLLDGARMPASRDLPAALEPLTKVQAYDVRASHFDDDVDALASRIAAKFEQEAKELAEFIAMAKGSKVEFSHELAFSTFRVDGDWVVKIRPEPALARQSGVETIDLAFTIADDKFNGTQTIRGRGVIGRLLAQKSRVEGIWKIKFTKEPSGEEIVKALVLEGVASGAGPFVFEIAFDRRLGDVYVGTDRSGNQFESKLISPAPDDSL